MAAEQIAQHLARHAGRSPRRDRAWRHNACVGKAGFFSGRAAPLKHGDLMAICGQLVSRGDTDDACAYDGDLHAAFFRSTGLKKREFMVCYRFKVLNMA